MVGVVLVVGVVVITAALVVKVVARGKGATDVGVGMVAIAGVEQQ